MDTALDTWPLDTIGKTSVSVATSLEAVLWKPLGKTSALMSTSASTKQRQLSNCCYSGCYSVQMPDRKTSVWLLTSLWQLRLSVRTALRTSSKLSGA